MFEFQKDGYVSIKMNDYANGNPKDETGCAFHLTVKGLGDQSISGTAQVFLSWKELKTVIQGFQSEMNKASRRYAEEHEDDEEISVADLTTNLMKGFFGC